MKIYIEVNGTRYPASITGRLSDSDWNDRASKAITCQMTYAEALNLFVDDIDWSIVEEYEEEDNRVEYFDNSEYSMAGDIIDHRNGTVTVKMGKPTPQELLDILEGAM